MFYKQIITCALLLASVTGYAAQVRYIDNSDTVDAHAKYFVQILKLAVEKSTERYGELELVPMQVHMIQDRQMRSIDNGLIDLMWTVTSTKREQDALPIRIPLLKGLIGYRVMVISEQRKDAFEGITSLPQLAKLSGLQGVDWPDSDILEHAGLNIKRVIPHNTMYKLVSSGIVDYYPRSVLEVTNELERSNDKSLIVEPYHLIKYPSAMYFFVTKDNKSLAQRLEFGLRQAIIDGSFDRAFFNFRGHKTAFDSLDLEKRIVFEIDNPLMPPQTPVEDKSLWFGLASHDSNTLQSKPLRSKLSH